MALERQLINLTFGQGLDTKSDAKQIPLGKLLTLQNAVFTSPGKLQKRNGYTALTTNILGGGTISTGAALFTRSNELCMADTSRNLYSYDSSNTAWVSKGKMPSITTTLNPISNPQYTVYGVDIAQAANGLQCCVYELYDINATSSQRKGIGYTLIDSTTGQIVAGPFIIDSTATTISPRVVVFGTSFVCYYIQGDLAATAGIFGRTLSSTSPLSGWSAGTQMTSGVAASAQLIAPGAYQFDVASTGTNLYIAFNNRSGGTTTFHCTSALAVAHTASVAGTTSRTTCVVVDTSGDVGVAYITNPNPARAIVYSSDLSVIQKAATTIDGTTVNCLAVTGCTTGTNAITWFVTGTVTSSAYTSQTLTTVAMTGATYVVGALSLVARSVTIGAKAFAVNGVAYVPTWFGPNTTFNGQTRYQSPQNGMYLLDSSGNVLAKALIGTCGALDAVGSATSVWYMVGQTIVSGSTALVPAATSNLLVQSISGQLWTSYVWGAQPSAATVINSQFGAVAVSFNFSDTTNNYLRGQLANTVHTSGGILQMYDGQSSVEHGFLIYPFDVAVTVAGAAGGLSTGTYQYIVCYEWMDGQGQLHHSTASTAVSVNAVATNTATIVVPTLRLTAKTGVMVQIYRTQANGSTFYQITNFNAAGSLFNDKTVDVVTWSDTQTDAAIAGNPQLYTTGGVLQNAPCNPAGAMTVHRNRLFVVDSTNPTQIWYSKVVSTPGPVEFSGFQVLNIDPKGGAITALASLDDKLIIFKSDRVFMVLGQGPDVTGGQNDFTDAMLVSADTGCAVPKSVVVVPDGVMFQSPKGIYMLSRALQMTYIGAPIEGLVGTSIAGAVLMPNSTQVRFSVSSGSYGGIFVYDYFVGQWTTFPIGFIGDSCIWNSIHVVNDTVHGIAKEVAGSFSDYGNNIVCNVFTGWIKLSGLQGFQRVYGVTVLGEYKSAHTLDVLVQYDYQTAVSQTVQFVIAADANPYQYKVKLTRQKCEAIQFEIADLGSGESFTLSGLVLDVGIKRGSYKLPAAQVGS